jgi:1-acyl-sn-glycerol-3-phosphate acyltransferase
MAEYWVPQLPFVSEFASRSGAVAGTPETCREMLEAGEAVLVFPEGVRGMNKLYKDRYKLQRFGTGFLRLALEAQVPIVPIAVVGSEEQQPGLANWRGLGRALGMPAFPVTPTFPWLGPLGLLPLPVKYRIYFGEPLHFSGSPTDEDAVIEEKVARVREAIEALFARGLEQRKGVFR